MAKATQQRKIAIAYVHDFLVKINLQEAADSLLDQALITNTATREEILRKPTNPLIGIISDWRKSQSDNLKDNEWFAAECEIISTCIEIA